MTTRRIAITGTIQGANRGWSMEDQDYRSTLPKLIKRHLPDVECFDPSLAVVDLLRNEKTLAEIGRLIKDPPTAVATVGLGPAYSELRTTFLTMTSAVGDCDLCVAYLPGTVSMGTAMEMYAAHLRGVPIITISDLVENLAIASVSDWIVRDLCQFEQWLEADVLGWNPSLVTTSSGAAGGV